MLLYFKNLLYKLVLAVRKIHMLSVISFGFKVVRDVYKRQLLTSALMQQLWLEIYKHTDLSTMPEITGQFSVNRVRLQLMMQFIHENYRRNLSLDEIAAQSMISKSSALNLFRSYLHITPVNYLINYRLKQAALLLSHTEKKVSTISAETGFHNVDYFCRAFKKHYQVTPGEYRKEKWDK